MYTEFYFRYQQVPHNPNSICSFMWHIIFVSSFRGSLQWWLIWQGVDVYICRLLIVQFSLARGTSDSSLPLARRRLRGWRHCLLLFDDKAKGLSLIWFYVLTKTLCLFLMSMWWWAILNISSSIREALCALNVQTQLWMKLHVNSKWTNSIGTRFTDVLDSPWCVI